MTWSPGRWEGPARPDRTRLPDVTSGLGVMRWSGRNGLRRTARAPAPHDAGAEPGHTVRRRAVVALIRGGLRAASCLAVRCGWVGAPCFTWNQMHGDTRWLGAPRNSDTHGVSAADCCPAGSSSCVCRRFRDEGIRRVSEHRRGSGTDAVIVTVIRVVVAIARHPGSSDSARAVGARRAFLAADHTGWIVAVAVQMVPPRDVSCCDHLMNHIRRAGDATDR